MYGKKEQETYEKMNMTCMRNGIGKVWEKEQEMYGKKEWEMYGKRNTKGM